MKFNILAALCALTSFLIADAVTYVGLLFFLWPQVIVSLFISYFSGISGMLHLLFIVGGAYFAYEQATIV